MRSSLSGDGGQDEHGQETDTAPALVVVASANPEDGVSMSPRHFLRLNTMKLYLADSDNFTEELTGAL